MENMRKLDKLELAKEVERIYLQHDLSFRESLQYVKEMNGVKEYA